VFSTDPLESAAEAGLRYVQGSGPCIRRMRRGKSFRYVGPDGKPLCDATHLGRIRALVIPPAWKNVWICPSPNGHLQAVGWDARGRKQYRYHPRYREVRDQTKFSRMIAFGTVLAVIRRQVKLDLKRPGLPKEKVLATVVRLLETSFIRVGNDEYAKENESFGLTTMKSRHVRIAGAKLLFNFRGKSGQEHSIELTDLRLARIVKQCQDLPGYELFQYIDEDGAGSAVDSADVNRYIRDVAGQDFTAKDFRTWAGTILAARELYAAGRRRDEKEIKTAVVAAVKRVAQQLGNRPATCRKYYIHPAMLEAYSDGTLFSTMEAGEQQQAAYGGLGLKPEEYCVMVIIAADQERLAGEARAKGIGSHRRSRRSSRRPQKTLVGAALAVSR
jgi:DNA topoisomerase-1